MYNTLQKLGQVLADLGKMSPKEFADLDNDTWQLAWDVRDCCKAIADRVECLEMLQPLPEYVLVDAPQSCECAE